MVYTNDDAPGEPDGRSSLNFNLNFKVNEKLSHKSLRLYKHTVLAVTSKSMKGGDARSKSAINQGLNATSKNLGQNLAKMKIY